MKNPKEMTISELENYAEHLRKERNKIEAWKQEMTFRYAQELAFYIVENIAAIKENPFILLRHGDCFPLNKDFEKYRAKISKIEKCEVPDNFGYYNVFDDNGNYRALLSQNLTDINWLGATVSTIPYEELLMLTTKEVNNERN